MVLMSDTDIFIDEDASHRPLVARFTFAARVRAAVGQSACYVVQHGARECGNGCEREWWCSAAPLRCRSLCNRICCSLLSRSAADMRMMFKFVQAATNTHRCSSVWRIAVCRCPVGRCWLATSTERLRPAALRALRPSSQSSEASSCARRWPTMQSTMQAIQARYQR